MGIIKIGKKHRDMMKDNRDQLSIFRATLAPEEIISYLDEWYSRNKIKFREKPNIKSWPFNMTTAYRKTLRLSSGWKDFSSAAKAATLAHERIHYMQRRRIGAFGLKYVMDARFLVAMETQAYREELRAWRSMGAGRSFLDDFARDLPGRLRKHYPTVPTLDYREVRKHVRKVLNDEIENPT